MKKDKSSLTLTIKAFGDKRIKNNYELNGKGD